MEEKTLIKNSTAGPPWRGEDWQRDLERRRMLVILGCLAWNMLFFVFFLLPLVKIYQIGNPHLLALANDLFSVFIGLFFWKKQKLPKQITPEQDDDDEKEDNNDPNKDEKEKQQQPVEEDDDDSKDDGDKDDLKEQVMFHVSKSSQDSGPLIL